MVISHVQPGEVVKVLPLGAALPTTETKALVKTKTLEVIRRVVPAGKEIPTHKTKGEIILQCLEGKIRFIAEGKNQDLSSRKNYYAELQHVFSLCR